MTSCAIAGTHGLVGEKLPSILSLFRTLSLDHCPHRFELSLMWRRQGLQDTTRTAFSSGLPGADVDLYEATVSRIAFHRHQKPWVCLASVQPPHLPRFGVVQISYLLTLTLDSVASTRHLPLSARVFPDYYTPRSNLSRPVAFDIEQGGKDTFSTSPHLPLFDEVCTDFSTSTVRSVMT
jgi:hypothetical protein